MVDKSLKGASLNGIFHDISGVQWVWPDHVRGYISNIGGYSTPHKKLRENTATDTSHVGQNTALIQRLPAIATYSLM